MLYFYKFYLEKEFMEINDQRKKVISKCIKYFKKAKIILTDEEKNNLEVTDFGLSRIEEIGLQLIVYINTNRVCAKEIVLLPNQICPEHRHPDINGHSGKEETFRCRWGEVYLYVPGIKVKFPHGKVPSNKKDYFTVWNEIILFPGQQYTLKPNTKHWFQAGPNGAIVSEFSTTSLDEKDIFTDPNIIRVAEKTHYKN